MIIFDLLGLLLMGFLVKGLDPVGVYIALGLYAIINYIQGYENGKNIK